MMITYQNLLDKAKSKLPEFASEYDRLINKDSIDLESGNHIVFSYAFTPVLINAIKRNDNDVIKRMFDFIEEMSASEDVNVIEVCDQSILEELNDEIDDRILFRYMGVKTKEGFDIVKTYMY